MKMKKLFLYMALLASPAAWADGSLLSPQQITQIAGMMFQAYAEGNVNQMFTDEMKCWDDASKTKRADKNVVAACATAAMAGTFIEASYARAQRRGAHPLYAGEAVRERLKELSGLKNEDLKAVWDSTLEPNVPVIMLGLQGAGMR
jgi:hypothetical protein